MPFTFVGLLITEIFPSLFILISFENLKKQDSSSSSFNFSSSSNSKSKRSGEFRERTTVGSEVDLPVIKE